MIAPAFSLMSPAGAGARLWTLIFHRVHARPDPMFPDEVDAAAFDRLCARLRRWVRVLPLDEAAARLREGTLPSRAAAITFDDGYADNHDVALPILRRHGLTATFFIATDFLGGGRMWNDTLHESMRRASGGSIDLDGIATPSGGLGRHGLGDAEARRRAARTLIGRLKYLAPDERQAAVDAVARASGATLPDDLMMSHEQVRGLHRAGMGVGGHTVSHPILARLDRDAARREIVDGRRALESITGAPVTAFAYPNGKPGEDYGDDAVAIVREEGFATAVSTRWGVGHHGSDPLQLPRFTPWDRSGWRFGLRALDNLRHLT